MSSAQAKPVLDRKAAEQINLNVLKRLDPQVEELLATAAHVALYDFDVVAKRWSRKDIEGSLFLVKRRGAPRFRFTILNKKSAENYTEDVGGGFNCEINKPYLLYRTKTGDVVGIWFYDEADCDRMAMLLQRIATTFAAPSEDGSIDHTEEHRDDVDAVAVDEYHAGNPADADGADDGVFWDKKVKVPKEVSIPGITTQGATTSDGDSNALAKVFAGMKVAPAPPSVQPSMPLLTPQFLQQQASGGASGGGVEGQGARLLQSLVHSGGSSIGNGSAVGSSSDGMSLPKDKVSKLLRALSNNTAFCQELATEMQRAGLLHYD